MYEDSALNFPRAGKPLYSIVHPLTTNWFQDGFFQMTILQGRGYYSANYWDSHLLRGYYSANYWHSHLLYKVRSWHSSSPNQSQKSIQCQWRMHLHNTYTATYTCVQMPYSNTYLALHKFVYYMYSWRSQEHSRLETVQGVSSPSLMNYACHALWLDLM